MKRYLLLLKKHRYITAYVFLLLLTPAFFYAWSLPTQTDQQSFMERVTSEEAEQKALTLVEKVGKLMALPQGETPNVATVSNADKMRSEQEFYALAENGDRILIFEKAHKVILYRERTNQVINVAAATFEWEVEAQKKRVAAASDSAEVAVDEASVTSTPIQSGPTPIVIEVSPTVIYQKAVQPTGSVSISPSPTGQ